MINLQVTLIVSLTTYHASLAIIIYQIGLESLRKSFPPSQLVPFNFLRITKAIGRYTSTVLARHSISLDRDTLLSNITYGTWRMNITVCIFQIISGNESILNNMINDSLRSLLGDASR
ncbi:hypothetical protein TX23_10030 [Pseudomonas paralactis]|uniref:Uncharacterized protein n=1 Tax=Pseudomonas paralactis TaxID=1615673 RepID=A0A0R3ASS5_9PSED|nr:hypothetical protein TX23_10030 [Pseudomonas paralactis]